MRLLHVSEEQNLERFAPRLSRNNPGAPPEPVVWAIGEATLHLYLVPRDCPRVCFRAGPATSTIDKLAFLGPRCQPVVAVEDAWLERIARTTLMLYELPPESFECIDAVMGGYVSRQEVVPVRRSAVVNLPAALARAGAELRPMPYLWSLHDQVAASTLAFNMIRMRNAQPRI